MTTLRESYEPRRTAWLAKINAAYEDRRRAAADIQRLKRDAAAARLAVLDAQLHHADIEKKIEDIRKQQPSKPDNY